MKYGQTIIYTDFFGYRISCSVDGYDTPEEAVKEAVELAKLDGWTNPKWWQWWRWGDTRIEGEL